MKQMLAADNDARGNPADFEKSAQKRRHSHLNVLRTIKRRGGDVADARLRIVVYNYALQLEAQKRGTNCHWRLFLIWALAVAVTLVVAAAVLTCADTVCRACACAQCVK